MPLPTMSGTGRLASDGELRYTNSGVAVWKVNIAFNSRKKDANGQWVDDSSFFVRGTLFKETAEHAADSFSKGDEVVVTGRLQTDRWETKDGEKRSETSLLIDAIGHTTRWAPSKSMKADRSKGGSAQSGDAWSTPAPAAAGSSFDSDPPF